MSRTYRFGPFHFDAETRLLCREGRPTRLSPKGADVLAVLLEAGNDLVPREAFLQRAWPGVRVEPGSLKVRIAEIRKVLGDVAAAPAYIATVPRRGYRFVGELAVESGDPLGLESLERPPVGVLPFGTDGSPAARRVARVLRAGILGSLARWAEVRAFRVGAEAGAEPAPVASAPFLVEGTARGAGPVCRVRVRLLDGGSGCPLWSGDFPDLPVDDPATLDRIVLQIGHELRRSFHPRAMRTPTSEVGTAWHHVLQARSHRWRSTRQATGRAAQEYLRALEIDPEAAPVHADLVGVLSVEVLCGWSKDLHATLAMSRHHAQRALELDSGSRAVQVAAAWDACSHRESERALLHLDRARELGPARRLPAVFNWLRSLALLQIGRLEEACAISSRLQEKALRHREGDLLFALHAVVQLHRGQVEEAARAADCASAVRPAWTFDCTAALAWWLSGDPVRADGALRRARRHRPDLSSDLALAHLGWMGPPDSEETLGARLRDLGLVDRGDVAPPLP